MIIDDVLIEIDYFRSTHQPQRDAHRSDSGDYDCIIVM